MEKKTNDVLQELLEEIEAAMITITDNSSNTDFVFNMGLLKAKRLVEIKIKNISAN